MTIETKGRWLFGSNAVINLMISIRGMIDPAGLAATIGGVPPNYPFMLRLWMGFVFMFGWMFWEVSRHPVTKHSLAKYNWIEKTITATVVTIGYISGQVPARLMILIILTMAVDSADPGLRHCAASSLADAPFPCLTVS